MTITLAELAQSLGARLWGDGSLQITGAAEPTQAGAAANGSAAIRSEERRVGEEGRSRWAPDD